MFLYIAKLTEKSSSGIGFWLNVFLNGPNRSLIKTWLKIDQIWLKHPNLLEKHLIYIIFISLNSEANLVVYKQEIGKRGH